MEEIIDKLIEALRNPNEEISEEFAGEIIKKGVIKELESDRFEVIPEVYQRIDGLQDKKRLLLIALKQGNELAMLIFEANPTFFTSIFKIEEIKNLNLPSSVIEIFIRETES